MVRKLLFLFLILFSTLRAEQSVVAHIFVHGTRLSFLSLMSIIPTVKRQLRNHHLYSKVVISSRDDDRFQDTQIMLDKGLHEIPRGMINRCRNLRLDSNFSRKAAIQVINGYDQLIKDTKSIHRHYTYGWDGMLADEYRKRDSLKMYKALIDLREQLRKQYPNQKIVFILHGHSHGGNLILYLAYHENVQKKGLSIDKSILYGTPIQAETAPYCTHSMFKTIINIYSEGDNIQTADKFSTASQTSGRRLADFVNTKNKNIIDVCVSAAGDRKAFGHASFFFIDMYQNGIGNARRNVFNELKRLPLVTFAPIFTELLEQIHIQSKHNQLTLNFYKENSLNCIISAETIDKRYIAKSKNIILLVNQISIILEKSWKPVAEHKGSANLAKLAVLDLMKIAPKHFIHPKAE